MLVYDYALRFDLNHAVVKLYANGRDNDGSYTRMYRHSDKALTVPWVNLLLTCKYVNFEVAAYMSLHNEDLRTYTVDIHASSCGFLRSSTLQKIPCSPSKVNTVLANIRIDFEPHHEYFQIVGDGGLMPIVRQLYQTLNLLLHNGPVLSRASPLRHPLKLKNLDIRAVVTSDDGSKPRRSNISWNLKWILQALRNSGLLQGYVGYVHIIDEDGHTELAIEAVDKAGVPTSWDGYGFEWGPNHDNSVKWITLDEEKASQ